MNGKVTQRHVLMDVTLRLSSGQSLAIGFVLDTGFQGALALPPAVVTRLGLPFRSMIAANLANDTDVDIEVYEAMIAWNGQELAVDVLATGRRPLLGTMLLDGLHLDVDFEEDGLVRLYPLADAGDITQ